MRQIKDHTFKVIRWLGLPEEPTCFGVVEIDNKGPILRSGPFDSEGAARGDAQRLERQAPKRRYD
jgi:hypothetical protein